MSGRSQSQKGERNSKMVFGSTASWNREDRGSKSTKSINKQGVLDANKALKEQHSKGQSAKMRKIFEEQNDPTVQQRKVADVAKARGNVIADLRNLNATEAEVKQALYKQKQQQLRGKKTSGGSKGKFALGDEGSNEMGQSMSDDILTHDGKSIESMTASEFRKYDRGLADSDSDEENKAIGKHETLAHFGGGSIDDRQFKLTRLSKEEWEKLSLPERYKFLIQMSKERKMLDKGTRSKARDDLSGLDAEYRDIMSMLDFSRGDDSDDDEMEHKLKKVDGLNGQSKEDYLQSLFEQYNIDPTADGGDDEDDEDKDMEGDDEDDDEDDEDEDMEDDEDSDDDDDIKAKKLDSKLSQFSSKSTATPVPSLKSLVHIDDDNDDEKYAKALGQSVAVPKIGLDGKAIGSTKTVLESGLRIGSNAGRDGYTALSMSLKESARQSAGTRVVSDQEKAQRHRNYLLFLEERRLKRKSGDYNADAEDELEKQYEQLFMTRRALKKQGEKDEDDLVVNAMMDGSDDDDDLDVSTGLRVKDSDDDRDDEDMEDEDDFDEDDFDEDDDDDESEDEESKPKKSIKKVTKTSGDSLDEDFLLDDDVDGIDYDDYGDEEIETMEVGGGTSQLEKATSAKRGRFGKDKKRSQQELDRRDAQTRLARKAEMGMFVNDIDGVLQQYYLSTENIQYRQFIAKMKVTIRDEIPYNYEFPSTFSEFISMYYTHLEPIIQVYITESNNIQKVITQLLQSTDINDTTTTTPTETENSKNKFLHLTESSLRGHVLSLILGRIFQLYHPRISASNEARIEYLYRFLWRLMKVVTQQQEYLQSQQNTPTQSLLPPPPNKAYVVKTIHDVVAIADVITSYIFTINELLPRHTGRACIGLMELFAHAAKMPDVGQFLPNPEQQREVLITTKKFGQKIVILPPEVHELFAYKLLMQLYPLSDARHTIMTPLQLLLVQSITQCYIASNTDLTRMVFLIGLLMEIWRASEKYIPEVVAALQSLISLLSNSFIPQSQLHTSMKQFHTNQTVSPATSSTTTAAAAATKPTKSKGKSTTLPTSPEPTTPFKWTPIILESWRECPCPIAPGTLNTVTTLPKQFLRENNRATGLIPLHWLTTSPLITQQSQTEYFRFAMLTTILSFISQLITHVKNMKSTNEVLQPIIQSLQSLVNNMGQFINTMSNTANETAAEKIAAAQAVADTHNKNKKQKRKAEEAVVSLTNASTPSLDKYTALHTQLTTVLAQAEQLAASSIIGRKPLEKYAAVILQKELEPRLDIDNKFNPSQQKQSLKDEVAERKRLAKQLASQQKTMRKQIKSSAFNAAIEQRAANAAKDEARKAKLTRARQIVQGDAQQDLQNRRNFKKQRR